MDDKLLDTMSESGTSGGGTDKLNNRQIQAKLQKLYAAHETPKVDGSVERMKARNTAIRLSKHIPLRGEESKLQTCKTCKINSLHYQQEKDAGECYPCMTGLPKG